MIDHALLLRPILPASRSADLALRAVVALYLKRHARVGVSWESMPEGLLIKAGEAEHQLELRNGPNALDDALRQLTDRGVLR